MEYNIDWNDIIDYFESNSIGEPEKEKLIELLDFEPNWKEVKNYLKDENLSTSEQDEILSLIHHQCEDGVVTEYVIETDKNSMCLPVETLLDVQKFEIVRNLYNNCTLDELQGFEKGIKIRII